MPQLTPDQVDISYLSAPNAAQLVKDAIAQAARVAPCLTKGDLPQDDIDYAISLIREAIEHRVDSRAVTETETAGPHSIRRGIGGVPGRRDSLFTQAQEARLAALCTASAPTGLPRGGFPEPDDYSGLFARPKGPR